MKIEEIQKLRELAQAASAGPWAECHPAGDDADLSGGEKYHWTVRCPSKPPAISHTLCKLTSLNLNEDNDAAYIAALSPDVVESLLALAERQLAQDSGSDPIGDLQAEARQAKMDEFIAAAPSQPAAPEEQQAQDRIDAERYRWWKVKRCVSLLASFYGNGCVNKTIEGMDVEIDALRAHQEPTK